MTTAFVFIFLLKIPCVFYQREIRVIRVIRG